MPQAIRLGVGETRRDLARQSLGIGPVEHGIVSARAIVESARELLHALGNAEIADARLA